MHAYARAGARAEVHPGSPRSFPAMENLVIDLAVIIVSTNESEWLAPCLVSLFAHLGNLRADVIVVDNESSDGTSDLVAAEFPEARVVRCSNLGFGHANNRALMASDARYVLFLNPDTEVVEGTFENLVGAMDAQPDVGLIGVRQVDGEGRLDADDPSLPNAARALGDAFSVERLPGRPRWLGERELDVDLYDQEVECDWTSGSFMLARREAIESAGFFDERFFMYSDETDLAGEWKMAGWEVRHLPSMTIVHYAGKAGIKPGIESLSAYTRLLYAAEHFSPVHRVLYAAAVLLRHALRSVYAGRGELGRRRRQANRTALKTLLGRAPVPHGPPSRFSVHLGQRPDRLSPSSTRSPEEIKP